MKSNIMIIKIQKMIDQIKLLFFFLFFYPGFLLGEKIEIVNLKIEYTKEPLGIDVAHPRFSWQMHVSSNERGCKQTAYQLVVTNDAGHVVWDSYKTNSDISLNVEYGGNPLLATTRYRWVVSVWDQNNRKYTGTSWFETGLMNPEITAWDGAKWIGGDDNDMVLYSAYLPVFKINYLMQLDEKSRSTHAGFVYGANDKRLMDRDENLYHMKSKKDSFYILVEIDVSPLDLKGNAMLNIYRVGYHPEDKKSFPYKSFYIPASIINDNNKYAKHSISFSSVLGYTRFSIDGNGKENFVAEVNLNPLGRGGDFIAFPVVGDVGFCVPKNQVVSFSNLEIRNYRSPSNVIFTEQLGEPAYRSIFSGLTNGLTVRDNSYKIKGGDSGIFVVTDPSRNAMPMLRTIFLTSQSKIAKARLYVTSRGIYEVYLNGNRIGNDYFNPGFTQYNKTHLYQTYDVTRYIQPGKNALGALLAEGWWSGGATYMGEFWNFFGDRQSLLAKLVITYSNGKEDIIVTNPSLWQYFNKGPIVYGSFFQGEVYDASKEKQVEGWSTVSYDANLWKPAKEVALEGNISKDFNSTMPRVDDYSKFNLTGQFGQTIKVVKELCAISVEEVRPGVYVYDMGQNIAGVPKINLKGMAPGKRVNLRFAEVKYPNLPEYKDNVGMIMLENIRAAMAQDVYITKGGNEIISPRFTYHGYRFVEVTGIEKSLPVEAVKAIVISSIDGLASSYETSNP